MEETRTKEDGRTIRIPKSRKPRVRALNDALVSLGGGRMRNPKDYNRTQLKREVRALLEEEE